MKFFIYFLFSLVALVLLIGCGNNDTQSAVTNYPAVEESVKTLNMPILKESDVNG